MKNYSRGGRCRPFFRAGIVNICKFLVAGVALACICASCSAAGKVRSYEVVVHDGNECGPLVVRRSEGPSRNDTNPERSEIVAIAVVEHDGLVVTD